MTVTDELIKLVLEAVENQTPNRGVFKLDLSHIQAKQEDLDETVQHCVEQGWIELGNVELN